jgi:hypothetical protein
MTGILSKGITRYPQKVIDEARKLNAEGQSYHTIATRLGISSDVVVRRWCDDEFRRKYNEHHRLKARGEK